MGGGAGRLAASSGAFGVAPAEFQDVATYTGAGDGEPRREAVLLERGPGGARAFAALVDEEPNAVVLAGRQDRGALPADTLELVPVHGNYRVELDALRWGVGRAQSGVHVPN